MSSDAVSVIPNNDLGEDGIRIYICNDCKQFIPIPSDGTPPYKYDYLLHKIEEKHGWAGHHIAVVSVNKKAWDHDEGKKIIVQQLKTAIAGGGGTGLGAEFYEIKDQFHEDAMSCWKAHNRTHNCDDFRKDKMRIMPDTVKERRSEGLAQYRSNLFLCNYCPMNSLVEQAIRAKKVDKGLY